MGNQTTAPSNTERTFDKKKLLMMSIGTFVGSGVVSILGVATASTGYSVWLAYLLAILIGFLSALPYFVMSSVMTFNGGTYTIACTFMGHTFGGAYVVSTFTSGLAVAMMASAFGTYVNSVFPSTSIRWFAVGILLVFWIVNCMGIDFMASVQKYTTYILLATLAVFCIVAYTQLSPETFHFSGPQFMTNGVPGLMAAMAMLVFSAQSYDLNIYTFGKYAKDPRRTVPWTMFMTVFVLILVYCGVAIAAVGGAGLENFSGQPLTTPARLLLPGPIFYLFIIFGPVLCLTTTINGCIANFTVALEKATEDGWFPKSFADKNRRGAAWKILTAVMLVCVIPILFSINIGVLTNNTVFLNSCLQIPLLISFWMLPDKFPEAFSNNTLHISKQVFHLIMVVAIAARLLIFYWSLNSLNLYNALGTIIAVVVCFLFSYLRYKTGIPKVTESYFFD